MVRQQRQWRVPKKQLPVKLREHGLNSKELRYVKKIGKQHQEAYRNN
jgi:hypothetical protein